MSTRKVSAIIEQLCGSSGLSIQVSQAAALLDEKLEACPNSALGGRLFICSAASLLYLVFVTDEQE